MNDVRLKELLDQRETEVRRELTKHEDEVRRLEDRLARGWEGTGALEPELKRHYQALGLIETTFRLRLGAETRDSPLHADVTYRLEWNRGGHGGWARVTSENTPAMIDQRRAEFMATALQPEEVRTRRIRRTVIEELIPDE